MASSGAGLTGSGGGYGVTPEYIQAAAASANATADNIMEQLDALKSYVVSLEDAWKGIAADTFAALMTDYGIYSQMLYQALVDIASGLQGNFVNYSESEQQNISNLKVVGSSVPGSNFF
jgi:WXG100 family type VII secretion target